MTAIRISNAKSDSRIIPQKTLTLREICNSLPYSFAETKEYVKVLCDNGLLIKVGKDKYKVVTTPSMLGCFGID
jgi:hypothetical protein